MSDPYLLLTPILLLLVLALVRFVGCDIVFGLEPLPPPPPAPTGLTREYGDQRVKLTWNPSPGATSYIIRYGVNQNGPYPDSETATTTSRELLLDYGVTKYYVVHAVADTESSPSNEVDATGARPLIAAIQSFGMLQNYFTGWLGMQITVGASPVKVVALGRVNQQTAKSHNLKIAGPVTPQPQPDPQPDLATAPDLVNGAVTVSPQGGVVVGDFRYATLANPATLAAGTTYFVISEEIARAVDPTADQWHDYSQMGVANPDATLDRAVYQEAGTYTLPKNGFGRLYVPVNILYHPG